MKTKEELILKHFPESSYGNMIRKHILEMMEEYDIQKLEISDEEIHSFAHEYCLRANTRDRFVHEMGFESGAIWMRDNYQPQSNQIDWSEIHRGLKTYCYTMQDDFPSISGKCIDYLKQKLNENKRRTNYPRLYSKYQF